MSDKTEAPKNIWLQFYGEAYQESAAPLEAAVSLHHWLFELRKYYSSGKKLSHERALLHNAQLALDKWDRFVIAKSRRNDERKT